VLISLGSNLGCRPKKMKEKNVKKRAKKKLKAKNVKKLKCAYVYIANTDKRV